MLHAAYPPLLAVAAATDGNATYSSYLETARVDFARFFTGEHIAPTHAHLVPGDPATVLPRFAKQLHAGIVVMGAVSRSGLGRVFIGNTAEQVLESLPCDVLVVKPDGFRTAIGEDSRGLRIEVPPPLALTLPAARA